MHYLERWFLLFIQWEINGLELLSMPVKFLLHERRMKIRFQIYFLSNWDFSQNGDSTDKVCSLKSSMKECNILSNKKEKCFGGLKVQEKENYCQIFLRDFFWWGREQVLLSN